MDSCCINWSKFYHQGIESNYYFWKRLGKFGKGENVLPHSWFFCFKIKSLIQGSNFMQKDKKNEQQHIVSKKKICLNLESDRSDLIYFIQTSSIKIVSWLNDTLFSLFIWNVNFIYSYTKRQECINPFSPFSKIPKSISKVQK